MAIFGAPSFPFGGGGLDRHMRPLTFVHEIDFRIIKPSGSTTTGILTLRVRNRGLSKRKT